MRPVIVTVTNITIGIGTVRAYPDGAHNILYEVPTYRIRVSGKDNAGTPKSYDFEALRFGVQLQASKGVHSPRVVGLADAQTHTLSWSFITTLSEFAWRVYAGFFIHKGPVVTNGTSVGSIGCVEISGANGWANFNTRITELAGTTNKTEITNNGLLKATYQAATRPPLIRR